ncbi:MAG: thioredoxin domain-containing protein [Asgard group archaeon]|nr:thioredoxin domain-containing protein [Asgard group archaeon]
MTKDSEKTDVKFNHLKNEKSPYLLQHVTNPVDWYPWGDEAFKKAKEEDKPIFLSIGYSTCHWCHVMAHESFEDPEIAKLMNDTFVCIKVDREERPEIDNLYMSVCQMITGSGGWPLTIILDPDKRPITAGTYFPKESRFGRIGMIDLIPRIQGYWKNNRDELITAANEVISQLQAQDDLSGEGISQEMLSEAFKEATLLFDEENGGFRGAPKFPTPHKMLFLLRYWKRTGNKQALKMVEQTLQAMRKGGIYDHIGFGFHRYSTDAQWLLPHFEKMLYDQALLIIAYIETYQATKDIFYRKIADETINYVLREMIAKEGAFFSAEDADSEGEEGKFYTWTTKEIQELLDQEEAQFFLKYYNFQEDGNFRDQATNKKVGTNIPFLTKLPKEIAKELNLSEKETTDMIESIRLKLFTQRNKRIHPHKDDKILTDWNGLMITALTIAGRTLGNNNYINTAIKAMDFILNKMLNKGNRLWHRFRDGDVAVQGLLDDYVFTIWALLEIYETTFNVEYLRKAVQLKDILFEYFWDKENGAFYIAPSDGEELLVRKKEIYDGAIPSGNSVAMLTMLKLSRILGDPELEEKAQQINKNFSLQIEQALIAHSMVLSSLEYAYGPSFEIVIVGNINASDTKKMLTAIRENFIPNKVVLLVPLEESNPEIEQITEFVKYKTSIDGKATAHVCINRFCKFPTNDINIMLEQLKV